MYVLNQGSTENDMISDVFLLYLLDRKRGAAKDYLKEAKTEGVMDPLQDGDLSSLHSQQIEKENVKSEYPSQLGLLRAQRKGIQIRRKNETCQFQRFPLPLPLPFIP